MSSYSDLPPISHGTLSELRVKRSILIKELSTFCISNYVCHDMGKANDLLRSYACSIFDLLKDEYSQEILAGEWESQIAEEAAQLTLGCWRIFDVVSPREGHWDETVRIAIVQHLGRPLRGTVSSALLLPPGAYPSPPRLIIPPSKPKRLSPQITSLSAARKMEAYMDAHGLNQTEFAIQAKTSDKTIRKFRRTGQVKRSILTGIAAAMGMTKDELLHT